MEAARTKLYFTSSLDRSPLSEHANPRFFRKDITTLSGGLIISPIRFARTKSTANDVNRTAGGLGHGNRAPNLWLMDAATGSARPVAWVLPSRAPRRLRLYTNHIEA